MQTHTKRKRRTPNRRHNGTGSWFAAQAELKQKEFTAKAREFAWQLQAGSMNVHVLDTLRTLEWLYLEWAAYRMAGDGSREAL